VRAAEARGFQRAGFAVKDETAVEGHGRQSDLHTLELGEDTPQLPEISFWMEALCSGVEAFLQLCFQLLDLGGMVTISCFTRGIPRCSMLVRVASEEMISTPAGQELGYASLPW